MTKSISTAADAGRHLLRPRFLFALVCVLGLTWITFTNQDSIKSPAASQSARQASGKSRKTVAESLVLAEKNYQKSINQRKSNLRSQNYDTSPQFDAWNAWMNWWWWFPAAFTCPHEIERIGNYGDGGKWVCGISLLEEEKNAKSPRKCVVYSLGVSSDSSFESAIVERTGCDVFAFDASVNGMAGDAANNPRIHFEKIFIGNVDKVDEHGATWKKLSTIMKEKNHEWIDILKMDIEGSEFVALESLSQQFKIMPFSQLQVEIHLIGEMEEKDKASFSKFVTWFELLEKFHLRPFWNELNMVPVFNSRQFGVIEYSFINLAGDHYLLRD
ncbi:hypothetical protein BGZ83_001190 [Gryganskiella cystojenkinii]|nr:hypothetical protein BGZ83_001190 [Gryganskiella cystojenkinii]